MALIASDLYIGILAERDNSKLWTIFDISCIKFMFSFFIKLQINILGKKNINKNNIQDKITLWSLNKIIIKIKLDKKYLIATYLPIVIPYGFSKDFNFSFTLFK